MFVTTDGGSTWQKVSAIPVGSGAGITGILFDPAIGGAVGGVTQTIFASSYGNGVYESTNGGATWTALTGGPTDVEIRRRLEHRRLLRGWQRQFVLCGATPAEHGRNCFRETTAGKGSRR